ncbi:RNA polymerase sigma factor [Streptococcus thoraltensis]
MDRQIFELKVEEGKSYSAIARIIGISDKTVKSHYIRAKTTLRFLLADYQ